jgi:hypothetical protein
MTEPRGSFPQEDKVRQVGWELISTFTAALARIGEGGARGEAWRGEVCGFPPMMVAMRPL